MVCDPICNGEDMPQSIWKHMNGSWDCQLSIKQKDWKLPSEPLSIEEYYVRRSREPSPGSSNHIMQSFGWSKFSTSFLCLRCTSSGITWNRIWEYPSSSHVPDLTRECNPRSGSQTWRRCYCFLRLSTAHAADATRQYWEGNANKKKRSSTLWQHWTSLSTSESHSPYRSMSRHPTLKSLRRPGSQSTVRLSKKAVN